MSYSIDFAVNQAKVLFGGGKHFVHMKPVKLLYHQLVGKIEEIVVL